MNEPEGLRTFRRGRRGQLHARMVTDRHRAVADDRTVDANPRGLEPLFDASARCTRELGLQALGEAHGDTVAAFSLPPAGR